jgi:hypothetical protein
MTAIPGYLSKFVWLQQIPEAYTLFSNSLSFWKVAAGGNI